MNTQDYLYCIMHEYMDDVFGGSHAHIGQEIGNWDLSLCYGPFASYPPPELEEDWELNVCVPSLDEMIEINATAVELMTEFELVELQ